MARFQGKHVETCLRVCHTCCRRRKV